MRPADAVADADAVAESDVRDRDRRRCASVFPNYYFFFLAPDALGTRRSLGPIRSFPQT
jgi:hypothetical protein